MVELIDAGRNMLDELATGLCQPDASRMALERPLAGHGLGSWAGEWRQRVTGSALLQGHTTPHNEYLLLAFQGGLVAWALLAALFGRAVLGAVGHHGHGVPALLVLAAFAWCGLTNVALRDVKFALPLLSMAGMVSLLLGLVVVVPWLAHASWHAYTDLVEPVEQR